MAVTPWYVGQTAPALQITLNTDSGQDNITGLVAGNFAMVLRNTGTGSDTNGTGTFVILNASPAVVSYAFSSGDVTTAANYQLIIKATFPTGIKVYDPILFTLTAI